MDAQVQYGRQSQRVSLTAQLKRDRKLTLVSSSRYMPYVGYVTIALNDYPKLKYLLLGAMGLSLLFQKE